DDDVRVAGGDRLNAERHGLEPGAADLVDGERGDLDRNLGIDTALARGILTKPRLQHVAHDHFVDHVRPHTGALERLPNCHRPELHRREVFEGASERSDGRTARGSDEHVTHQAAPPKSIAIRSLVSASRTSTNARRRSVSVTMPTSSSPSTTGSPPNFPARMIRAASSTRICDVAVTTLRVMICSTVV